MLIIRYFVFVGLFLTALLFAADRYLPASVDHAHSADPDKTTIRIRSARSLPEKIVLDTHSPAMVAPMAAAAEVANSSSREAFAAMTEATAPKTEDQKPLAQKVARQRPRAKRSAKPVRRPTEKRLAFDHRDFSGTW
ncbi:hypothetical protein Q2941_42875 [Bradyrhizobium sp. UFLA05-153]